MADENNAPFVTYSETDAAALTTESSEPARDELEATVESVQLVEVEGGDAPFQNLRAAVSLMIATRRDFGPSNVLKSRPRTIGIFIVSK